MTATSPMSRVLQQLRGAALRQSGAGLTDAQLLGCFLERRDEAAFAALVYRHGPMVWGVCRRILRDAHEAEDAFQATFLVLVHKAASVVPRHMVGNWLYGVARQTAVRARAAAAKRRLREKQAMRSPVPEVAPVLWDDLEPVLDEELSRLPDKYRAPVVLCDLEGKSRKEAAAQLGWREGTVSGRLARARALLAQRLARRGLAVSGGTFVVLLAENAAPAAVPAAVLSSTIRSAALVAAGRSAGDVLPPAVAALSGGVLKAMLLTKLKIAAVALLFAALVGYGVGALTHRATGGERQSGDKRGDAKAPEKLIPPGPAARGGSSRVVFECKEPVSCLAWSAKGDWLAAGTREGTVHIVEVATGKHIKDFPVGGAVAALAFSPDGKSLAVSRPGQTIGPWSIATGKQIFMGGGVGTTIEHLAYTPDGRMAAGVGMGCFVQFGAIGSGASSMTPPAGVSAAAPDGLVSGWCDANTGILRYFYTSRGKALAFGNPLTLAVGNARSLAFAPGGQLVVVGGDEKSVRVWSLEANKQTRTLSGLDSPASRLTFSADGNSLAALADDGRSVRVWDFARGTIRCRINHPQGAVGTLALSPDGKSLATAVKDGKTIFLWNATPRQLAHAGPPLELAAKELAALWDALAGPDADKAEAAWLKLGAAGDNAVPFLRQRIWPVVVPAADVKAIEGMIADLDSVKFLTRERGFQGLLKAGELAVVPLQRCLEKQPPVEIKRRAELLLQKIGETERTPERSRVFEVIDLLEQMRTPRALALLEEIERDTLIAPLRAEAGRALRRVAQASLEKK
jgi:RNA polymerase sigma factor (sigma-70 family)